MMPHSSTVVAVEAVNEAMMANCPAQGYVYEGSIVLHRPARVIEPQQGH